MVQIVKHDNNENDENSEQIALEEFKIIEDALKERSKSYKDSLNKNNLNIIINNDSNLNNKTDINLERDANNDSEIIKTISYDDESHYQ